MSQPIPQIKESSHFTFLTSIWIVPFIALMIAGWLAYQYFDDLGTEIEIVFPKNEGLIAGQSVVKFKNVPIGKVTKIYIKKDIDGVVVRIRMHSKASTPYMNEHAKFWIVKPEVGFSGISGLDTIISGTYINVYSKEGSELKKEFIGLSTAYKDTSIGQFFHLISHNAVNLSVGMPVFYQNMKVGQIEYKYLSLDNKNTEIILFIKNEYASYVHIDSKFWTKNAISLDLSKGKFNLDIAPLKFLLTGGIVFSSSGEDEGKKIPKKATFTLYKNEAQAQSHIIASSNKEERVFLLLSKNSVAGLSDGSVVRFEGFDVGKVVDIDISYNKSCHKMSAEILVKIETAIFKDKNDINSTGEENFYLAVQEGLRAKITDLDPITGAQFINLTFSHQDHEGKILQRDRYAIIPMTSQTSSGIMSSVTQILDKLNNLALEELLASVQKVVEATAEPIENTNKLILSLSQPIENANTAILSLNAPINNSNKMILALSKPIEKTDILLSSLQSSVEDINRLTSKESFNVMPDELNKVLQDMSTTLEETTTVIEGYDSNSLIKAQLAQTLQILTKTSQEMQFFLRMLNRKPNSLIFGDN